MIGMLANMLAKLGGQQDDMALPPRQDRLTPQNMTLFQLQQMLQPRAPSPPARDPMQAGPSPPVGEDLSQAVMFYPGSNTVENGRPKGQLASMARRGGGY